MNKLSAFLKHFLKPYSLFPKKAICFSGSIFLSSSLILVLAAVWKDFERVFIIFATTNLAAGVDVLFITEHNENIWWYDGERVVFRSPNYSKILNAMLSQPTLTLSEMQSALGINRSAVQKLIAQLTEKKYVERGEKEGSWRVYITPSN